MARVDSYVCDVCKAVKGEGNHWWKVFTLTRGNTAIFAGCVVVQWEARNLDMSNGEAFFPANPDFHLCGESCVTKKVSELMSNQPKKEVQHEQHENHR